ncbi:MAG TPA: hypothetical protein VK737_03685 [Opitutales bacterium]|jgi:hypothetical protein|nr:hypothetical protein [Opitutales bacterium]
MPVKSPRTTADASRRESGDGAERTVTNLVSAWVVIIPWLIGARFWWVLVLGMLLGAVALITALRSENNRRTLWRFPIFWLGLLFLIFVACQAFNYWGTGAQRHSKDGPINVWDVTLHDHVNWLPSGINADFTQMGSALMLIYWAGPWLLVCAWWAAVRKRRSGQRLCLIVFINGVVMALVVLLEHWHPPAKILGIYVDHSLDPDLFRQTTSNAGFSYHNHAAAFLYLSLGAGFAVVARLLGRAQSESRDNGLAWVAFLGCLVILSSFFVLGSRAGLVIACALFVLGFVVMLVSSLAGGGRAPGLWVGSVVLVLALGGMVTYELQTGNSSTLARWKYLNDHPEDVDVRQVLRMEAKKMMDPAHYWMGWGAGSFRYNLRGYLYADNLFQSSKAYGGTTIWTDYVHCDWIQIPLEYGVIGAGLVAAMLLYGYGSVLWYIRYLGSSGIMVLLAVSAMLAHALIDFPFFNSAVFTLFAMLSASTLKTTLLSARRAAK